jgi:transcriptional regulator with PAS, ATPase and Fis domain
LFLDEIGELPLPMQPALLRVLEDGSFIRVGSSVAQQSNCRVIAATHRNLEELVAAGKFRQDLYYRLKIVQKKIKPIRERIGDIGLLVEHFLQFLSEKHGLRNVRIHQDAQSALEKYPWPGNAREIRNVIEAAMLCAEGDITLACLPPEITWLEQPDADRPVDVHAQSAKDYERQLIIGMLKKYRKVNHVARAVGLARSTLYRKFAELGIDQRGFASGALD